MKNVIIAFFLPLQLAEALALPGGEAAADLHLTLANLGQIEDPEKLAKLRTLLAEWAATRAAVEGEISGLGRFSGETEDCLYASVDAPLLPEWRQHLLEHLKWNDFPVEADHGFTPHVTLSYLAKDAPLPVEQIEPRSVTFSTVTLAAYEERFDYELIATKSAGDLVAYGGAVKALGGGRVGGYLVVWSHNEERDLEGDYFTADTDLKWPGQETRTALYHHGLDETLGPREIGDGLKKVKTDNVGLWVETQLNLRDEWEEAIYDLAQKKKLGFSSGTASHMIIREADGKIVRWPIIEGSLTPTPAEPRTMVVPLKAISKASLQALRESEPAGEAADTPEPGRKRGVQHKSKAKKFGGKMDLLEVIKKLVPGLADEQYEQIGAVLALAGQGGAAAEEAAPDPTMTTDPAQEEEDPDTPIRSAKPARYRNPANAPQGQSLAQAVAEALKALGIAVPAKTAARPPYQFKPAGEQSDDEDPQAALKSVAILRYGETEPAIKGVTRELYGDGYEVKRLEQHRSFTKYCRSGKEALGDADRKLLKTIILTPAQLKKAVMDGVSVGEIKAEMNAAIGELGSFLVPEDIRLDFIQRLPGKTQIRSRADVSTTSSDIMTRVKVTGGDSQYVSTVRVTYVGDTPAENAADTAPTFGLEKTPVHIVKATVPVPVTLLEDTAYPLTQKLGEWVTNAYSIDEDRQLVTGNGVAKPEGFIPGGVNKDTRLGEVVNGSTTAIDGDKLIELMANLDEQYLDGAVWLMNKLTAGEVRKLKGGDGHYLWAQGFENGKPDTLLGFEVARTESMPAIATNAYPIAFGNLYESIQIADRIGMSLLRDELTEAEQDIVKFLFRRRYGAQLKAEWALKLLKMATS
jgi:HK97 family phage major capsid protein